MTTKHSPGPWKALSMEGGSHHIVSEPWGSSVAVTMFPEGSNEREANAQLISAAPDLLEALQKIHSAVSQVQEDKDLWYIDEQWLLSVCAKALSKIKPD